MSIDCHCLVEGPRHPAVVKERFVGIDTTEGRYADVSLMRCKRCQRLWLRYQLEYEAFSRSGRWAEAPIDEQAAATMVPESAAGFLESAEFHIYGGSFWGHTGKRGSGRLPWGVAGWS